MKPMYVETEYVAEFKVLDIIAEKNRAIVETIIKDKATGLVCTSGEATVMNTNAIK